MQQNNNTQLPKEVVEQIEKDADEYARTYSGTKLIKRPYTAGATAYAQWKVRFDEQAEQLRQAQLSVKSLRYSLDQRDQQLKERAERMQTALEWIKTYGPDQSALGQAFIDKALKGKEVELTCMVCSEKFMGPEPKMCCGGRDC